MFGHFIVGIIVEDVFGIGADVYDIVPSGRFGGDMCHGIPQARNGSRLHVTAQFGCVITIEHCVFKYVDELCCHSHAALRNVVAGKVAYGRGCLSPSDHGFKCPAVGGVDRSEFFEYVVAVFSLVLAPLPWKKQGA